MRRKSSSRLYRLRFPPLDQALHSREEEFVQTRRSFVPEMLEEERTEIRKRDVERRRCGVLPFEPRPH